MKQSRGFTLLEVVIVVASLTVAIALSVLTARSWKNAGEQAVTVVGAASTMEAFAKACATYVDAREASMVVGAAPTIVTAAQLVASGDLDAWAATSPLGQPYVAYVARVEEGTKPRIVATESGDPSPALLDRLELPPGVPNLITWKQDVARSLVRRSPTAAVIAPGTTLATGAGFGWTKDVIGIAPTASSAGLAVLVNFPDLAFVDAPPPPPPSIDPGNCVVVSPTLSGLASCPVDAAKVASWPYCGRLNKTPGINHADVYSSDIGAVVVGVDTIPHEQSTSTLFGWACSAFLGGYAGCINRFRSNSFDAVAVLNGYEVGRDRDCESERWVDASPPLTPPTGCVANYSNEPGNFRACKVRDTDAAISLWGVAGKDILCCTVL